MPSLYAKRGWLYLKFSQPENGRLIRRQVALRLEDTRENRKIAKQKLTALQQGIIDKDIAAKLNIIDCPTLSDAVARYIATQRTPATIRYYETVKKSFLSIMPDQKLTNYTELGIANYFKKLGETCSEATLASYSRGLHAIFQFAVRQKWISANPVPRIKAPKPNIEIIPEDELKLIVERLNPNQKLLVEFLYLTGFRVSTALVQRWENIQWSQRRILAYNVKAKHEFIHPLTDDIAKLLEPTKKASGLIFEYSVNGLKFWVRVQKKLLQERKIARVYKLHSLRRNYATRLAERGVDRMDAKHLLDHSDARITDTVYTAVNIDRLRDLLQNAGSQMVANSTAEQTKWSKMLTEILEILRKNATLQPE